jgi:hypothetical protein
MPRTIHPMAAYRGNSRSEVVHRDWRPKCCSMKDQRDARWFTTHDSKRIVNAPSEPRIVQRAEGGANFRQVRVRVATVHANCERMRTGPTSCLKVISTQERRWRPSRDARVLSRSSAVEPRKLESEIQSRLGRVRQPEFENASLRQLLKQPAVRDVTRGASRQRPGA